jgi:hypothetical protein
VLKKLMMLVAMLAMVVSVAVPAIAQVHHILNNGFGQNNGGVNQGLANESESGNVTPTFSVTSSGDNSNQCVQPLQFGNTGNLNNAQGFLQYASNAGDLEAEGPSFTFAPQLNGGCTQQVQQSSAASSG